MRYVFLGLLAALAAAVLLLIIGIWTTWSLYLHVRDKKLTLELRALGFRRTLLRRDFSAQKPEKPASKAEAERSGGSEREASQPEQGKGSAKKNRFSERWSADKKRIYDPEKGGYQPGGLEAVLAEYRDLWDQGRDVIHTFFGNIRYRIEVPMLRIRLDFGTGNPAHTGMAYGAVWGAVGMAYPVACRYVHMAYPAMEVTPDFYEKRFDLEIRSIIKVRPAHIINALLKQGWRLAVTYCYHYFNKGSVKHG